MRMINHYTINDLQCVNRYNIVDRAEFEMLYHDDYWVFIYSVKSTQIIPVGLVNFGEIID
ncbi:hypothetical protein AmaxDRAFT_4303 [Limnospira maxima CS-328]|uniref:Uncharacterized protein n=1 Tax=Limnospira maxima CS-328 TaxID=513049 RepID=B5W6A4_LIMMA|nr:hypothetical protein AmaxDRAFT_4303 [Limnospira maxima CS-328]RAQ42763.1 hypothetical protein B9S53_12315 [Arthrospira sp. O9.13F]